VLIAPNDHRFLDMDLKAMSNLLAKWAVKYSKFSKIGIVYLDGH